MLRHVLLGVGCMLAFSLPKEPETAGLNKEATFVSRITTEYVYLDSVGGEVGGIAEGTAFPFKVEKSGEVNKVYLLTAAHNINVKDVERVSGFKIEFFAKRVGKNWVLDSETTFVLKNVTVLKKDVEKDYAILTGTTTHYVCPSRLSTKAPKYMQEVVSVGCAIGIPPAVTEGLVSRESATMSGRWLSSSQVIYGNSGGPVYDKNTGEVIGITTGILFIQDGWTTIPITHLHLFLPISSVEL